MSSTAVTYGLTPAGFFAKSQAQITSEIVQTLRTTFGNSVNLNAESFIGQLMYIYAEREALLWQLGEATWASQFPNGAEGVAVDNILALNNLRRLQTSASKTNPATVQQTNGLNLYGLLLYGTAGTVIQQGSAVQTATNPSLVYTLDNTVTINAAVNAQQALIFSNPPTQGAYALMLSDLGGDTMQTGSIPFGALPNQTVINNIPAVSYQVFVDGTLTPFITPSSVTALVTALNNAGGNVSGSALNGTAVTLTHGAGYIPAIDTNPTMVQFSSATGTGTYSLTINGVTTGTLTPTSSVAAIQAAIVAAGFPTAKVALVNSVTYAISFGNVPMPATSIAISADTTPPGTFALLPQPLNQPAATTTPSVQSCINTLVNASLPAGAQQPYTDVSVTAQGGNYLVSFGAATPKSGQPASGAQPQPVIVITQNSLQSGNVYTNLTVNMNAAGAMAQAIATATCSQDGPYQALAGDISIIGSPVSGWTGVTNQLDTIAGTSDEDDTDALDRRLVRLAGNAQGPLEGIKGKVAALPGVTAVEGFENTSQASLQNINFAAVPASGTFQLILGNSNATTPISCTPIADPVTGALSYHPNASEVQAAINAIPAYASAKVAGSPVFGFSVDFSGSLGAQSQPLIAVANNTTGVAITASFGRTPNSFEIVVTGGDPTSIAQAIYAAKPGGIASYASPAAVTTGYVTVNSNQLQVTSPNGISAGLAIFGTGIPNGTVVTSISGNTVTMSNTALTTATFVPYTFSNAVQVSDADGNPTLIGFSRPTTVLFYVNVSLTTDQYRTPGNLSSGPNPQSQFQPGTVLQLQNDIVAAGNAVPVGGLVVGAGTGGLIGSFNEVPGVVGYTLGFDINPMPTKNTNIQLLPTQQALFEVGNISVSYL